MHLFSLISFLYQSIVCIRLKIDSLVQGWLIVVREVPPVVLHSLKDPSSGDIVLGENLRVLGGQFYSSLCYIVGGLGSPSKPPSTVEGITLVPLLHGGLQPVVVHADDGEELWTVAREGNFGFSSFLDSSSSLLNILALVSLSTFSEYKARGTVRSLRYHKWRLRVFRALSAINWSTSLYFRRS